MKFKILYITIISGLTALLLSACNTTLQSGGAYAPGSLVVSVDPSGNSITNFVASGAPNLAFYEADNAYNAAYSIVDAALKWENDNRVLLFRLDPDIKHTLDKIRPTAWDIQKRWAIARKTYEDNPIPANLTTIQTIVAQVQSIVPAATAAEAMVATNQTTH